MIKSFKTISLDFLQKKREQRNTAQMCGEHTHGPEEGLPQEGADPQLSQVPSRAVSHRRDVIP